MKLAIQADMLPGRTIDEQVAQARELGFDGVELWVDGLDDRLYEVAEALDKHEMAASALHMGRADGYLSTDKATREAAIGRLRAAMALSVDLEAGNVIFVPHWGAIPTPDLRPHRSAEEIASDLMTWLVRTVCDLGYALGTTLHMQPRHRYETAFLQTIAQAVQFSDIIKDHPHVRIAPSLFDVAMENSDPAAALREHLNRVGYLHLADSNGQLPGGGLIHWQSVADVLKDGEYDGWLCLTAGHPVTDPKRRFAILDALPASLQLLTDCGLR